MYDEYTGRVLLSRSTEWGASVLRIRYIQTDQPGSRSSCESRSLIIVTAINQIDSFSSEKIKKIWRHYKPIYQRLLPNQTLDTTKILLSITTPTDDKNKQKLTQTLTIKILYNIWKNRNKFQFDKTYVPQNKIIENINAEMKYLITVFYKTFLERDKLEEFKTKFCINDALCAIENDDLILNF